MFNPKVVKDEVDHSFFDSDYEDVGIAKKDEGMKVGEDEKGGSPAVPEPLRGRESQKAEAVEDSGPSRTDEAMVQSCLTKGVENKPVNYGSEVEDVSMASSMSSLGCNSDKVVHTGSDVEMSSMHSKSPNETFLVWPAKDSADDDEDGYHQSQDESDEEEDGLPSTHKASGQRVGKRVKTPKKFLRKRHSRTSSDTDTDTDSSCGGSSSSSSSESCALEPPASTRSKTTPPSTSTRMRRSSVGPAEPRERPATPPVEESEDSVTDVTPLSTPDTSPLQSLDLTQAVVEKGSSKVKEAEDGGLHEQQQQPEDGPSSVISRPEEDEEEASDMDKYSFSVESQLVDELVFTTCPGGRNRKNYSFSNDEVRRIDRENQRLLRRLSARSRPASSAGVRRSPAASTAPPVRVNHSGLNRQREQQRIERENLAFLKRLETIKPTPGMRRSEQLDDYQRQATYLGNASVSIYRPASKKQSSSTSPTGKGPRRPGSVVHHTRAASSSSDSTSRQNPKSSKVSVPRPAWS